MRTLTYDEAVAYLDRAVQEKGADYIYWPPIEGLATCFYFGPGDVTQKGCIIGHLLSYMGYTYEDFVAASKVPETNAPNPNRINSNSVMPTLEALGIEVDDKTELLLRAAQASQDTKYPWGPAVEYAKATVESKYGVPA